MESLQADEVHEHKIGRSERQTKTVQSFMSKYPPCMGETSCCSGLKTYDSWRGSDGNTGFAVLLEETLDEEKISFKGHLRVVLSEHTQAYEFCLKMFDKLQAWVEWFIPTFERYHDTLLKRASASSSPTGNTRIQCWDRSRQGLKVLFDELHKVRGRGVGAIRAATPAKATALYLHYTLQEFRVLQDFKTQNWSEHPKIVANLTEHILETYLPRDAQGGTKLTTLASDVGGLMTRVQSLNVEVGKAKSKIGVLEASLQDGDGHGGTRGGRGRG